VKNSTAIALALVVMTLCAATLLVVIVFLSRAQGADFATTQCRTTRGTDGSYWAWREIDGRRCWYLGRRGRDKATLSWGRPPEPQRPRETMVRAALPPPPLSSPPSANIFDDWPAPVSVRTVPIRREAPNPPAPPTAEEFRDAWLAANCCWPPLNKSAAAAPERSTNPWLMVAVLVTAAFLTAIIHQTKGYTDE